MLTILLYIQASTATIFELTALAATIKYRKKIQMGVVLAQNILAIQKLSQDSTQINEAVVQHTGATPRS